MHHKGGDPNRPRRYGRAIFPLALIAAVVLGGCMPPPKTEAPPHLPREIFVQVSKKLRRYTDALLLTSSPLEVDREKARREIRMLAPFYVFPDEPKLVREVAGTGPEAEAARRELGIRGRAYDAVLLFTGPYDGPAWDAKFRDVLDFPEYARAYVIQSLLQMLISPQFQRKWEHYRGYLIASGKLGRVFSEELSVKLAEQMSESPVANVTKLREVGMVLVGFGEEGRPGLEKLLSHRAPNVRRAAISAVGVSFDISYVDSLASLLDSDPSWQVRVAAATALGDMHGAQDRVGPVLLSALRTTRDSMVRRVIVKALGECRYPEAAPALIHASDSSDPDMADTAMQALRRITGLRFRSLTGWESWLQETYPAWLKKIRG